MSRGAIATIHLAAIEHNLAWLRARCAPTAKILAMVKCNAYGHGIVRVAHALKHADALGVACLTEALLLRDAKITKPIVVMAGFLDPDEIPIFIQQQLIPTVHSVEQLAQLKAFHFKQPFPIWVKLDTGMHRLGFVATDIPALQAQFAAMPNIDVQVVMTHLADADAVDTSWTEQQINLFMQATQQWSTAKSIANSAAILHYPNSQYDWVRPGIALYGVSPFAHTDGIQLGLKPAMELSARIIERKIVRAGERIGYNGVYQCKHDTPIGVIAFGYGDGYPRHAVNGTPTLWNEQIICPLVGRVSMDLIAIDLSQAPAAKVGDKIILWGNPNLPIERVAHYAQTSAYDLLCGVTARVHYQWQS